jgi:hypothetical protein
MWGAAGQARRAYAAISLYAVLIMTRRAVGVVGAVLVADAIRLTVAQDGTRHQMAVFCLVQEACRTS